MRSWGWSLARWGRGRGACGSSSEGQARAESGGSAARTASCFERGGSGSGAAGAAVEREQRERERERSGERERAAAATAASCRAAARFPDTFSSIAILTDQLPSGMPAAQQQFAATHYVGTEKQLLPDTQALRAINPDFIVLHYHLAMWQSARRLHHQRDELGQRPLDGDAERDAGSGTTRPATTSADRVTAPDGKFLMNVSVQGFADYWVQSLEQQVADGQYDAIMFDSASPSLLQGWCGGSGAGPGPAPRGDGGEGHERSRSSATRRGSTRGRRGSRR